MDRIRPLVAMLAVSMTAWAGDAPPTLKSRGAAVLEADAAIRAALPDARPKHAMPGADAPAFDWSERIKPDRARNQKESTASGAFAALSAFEWSWAIRNGENRVPGLAIEPVIDRARDDGTGSPGPAFDDLLRNGTCTAKELAHPGKAARRGDGPAMDYRAIGWGTVSPTGDEPSTAEIKRAIVDHGPVVASVYLTRAFQAYRGGVFAEKARPPAGSIAGGHSVVIVGWDDRKGREGCWRVENSWGVGWGERGSMWIEYGSNTIGRLAWWVTAQSTRYDLPEGVERLVDPPVRPFPKWPEARPAKASARR